MSTLQPDRCIAGVGLKSKYILKLLIKEVRSWIRIWIQNPNNICSHQTFFKGFLHKVIIEYAFFIFWTIFNIISVSVSGSSQAGSGSGGLQVWLWLLASRPCNELILYDAENASVNNLSVYRMPIDLQNIRALVLSWVSKTDIAMFNTKNCSKLKGLNERNIYFVCLVY